MSFSSKIEIKDKKAVLKAYYDALAPEADFKTGRAGYKLKFGKDKLTIEIAAKDATAFRAITTSLAGLMSIIDESIRMVK